ncbi:MAG: hypothetical protein ABIZ09_02540 [Rhodoferax sp.]
MLPKTHTESPTFQNFDDARKAIESLVPHESGTVTLTKLGLTPKQQPNTAILTQTDIVRRVFNGAMLGKADLDPGIVTCISAREAGSGWELNLARIANAR